MSREPKIELYSNDHVGKFFFIVKSLITFYLIQYHKTAFQDELFLSVYYILQMELYFPGLVKHHSQISALGCLERVANKKKSVTRKKDNW